LQQDLLNYPNNEVKITKYRGEMINFGLSFKRNCDIMVRKAEKRDIQAIIKLLHQVNMVHHVIRPDLFKPNTTKYNELELEALLEDESKPIFVYDNGQVLGHAFCMVTEVKDDKLLQNIKTLYIDDICVDEEARSKHVGTDLFEYVRDYAKSIGCNNITLNVWEGNDPALCFYRNMGMKIQKTTMEIKL
jgi:ribosomal protein S18 acetylase RimI-like enzyme